MILKSCDWIKDECYELCNAMISSDWLKFQSCSDYIWLGNMIESMMNCEMQWYVQIVWLMH